MGDKRQDQAERIAARYAAWLKCKRVRRYAPTVPMGTST